MPSTDTQMSGQPTLVFDRQAALERVEGDEALLKEIAQMFLDMCDDMIAEVRTAAVHRDAKALHIAAHTLKGTVANFGARDCVDASLALELKGRSGDIEGLEPLLLRLQLGMATLKPALQSLLEEA